MSMVIIAVIGIITLVIIACDNESAHTHDWQWGVTTSATADAAGLETETCTGCGEINGTRPIPILQIVQPNKTIDLDFGTDCKVTIKSSEIFSNPEWVTLVDKVEAAVYRGYNSDYFDFLNKPSFENLFGNRDTSIVLSSSTAFNCEVQEGNYTTLYLKISILDIVDIQPAVWIMNDAIPGSSYSE
jgi:hypothetical protein